MKTKFRTTLAFAIIAALCSAVHLQTNCAYAASPTKKTSTKKAPTKSAKSKPKKVDYNAIGFAAYLKKDYKTALTNFQLAMKNDPKNPYVYLNHARTIASMNADTDPGDYCDYGSNWIYQTLSSLSMGTKVGSKAMWPKLNEANEQKFAAFKKRIEYRNWLVASSALPATDAALEAFMKSNIEWMITAPGTIPTMVTFLNDKSITIVEPAGKNERGTWKVEKGFVVMQTPSMTKSIRPEKFEFFYDTGKRWFNSIALRDSQQTIELFMGPVIADCN